MGRGSADLQVPLDVLAVVLQHVQQRPRLRCCALVNKKWHQAANMATSDIKHRAGIEQGLDSLSVWLANNQYGSSVQSIQVQAKVCDEEEENAVTPVLQMPLQKCRQLQTLRLARCLMTTTKIEAPALPTTASSVPAAYGLASLTALSRLELIETLLDLSELSSCTNLQHLGFWDVGHAQTAGQATAAAADQLRQDAHKAAGRTLPSQLATALPHLTKLTYLQVLYDNPEQSPEQGKLAAAIAATISSLQNLQELQLGLGNYEAEHPPHLSTRLTTLHLSRVPALTLSTAPQLSQLTALQQLYIVNCPQFEPAVLSDLTQLTSLCLVTDHECALSDSTQVAELLAAVQQLTRMKQLNLVGCMEAICPDPELYAALTSCSKLEALDITDCCVAPDAWEYIFPAEKVCTALTSLASSTDLFTALGALKGWSHAVQHCGSCP